MCTVLINLFPYICEILSSPVVCLHCLKYKKERGFGMVSLLCKKSLFHLVRKDKIDLKTYIVHVLAGWPVSQ